MNANFINERIDATKKMIVAYEDAALALGNGVQSYTIDTGQTRTVVTRVNLTEIRKTIDSLYNRLTSLENRLNNGGVVVGAPSW